MNEEIRQDTASRKGSPGQRCAQKGPMRVRPAHLARLRARLALAEERNNGADRRALDARANLQELEVLAILAERIATASRTLTARAIAWEERLRAAEAAADEEHAQREQELINADDALRAARLLRFRRAKPSTPGCSCGKCQLQAQIIVGGERVVLTQGPCTQHRPRLSKITAEESAP